MSATTRPLHAVLDAVRSGAGTLDAVAARTGLSRDVVDGAVNHLVRVGRLSAETLSFGCPGSGCGSCVLGAAGGSACGTGEASGRGRGPVLVTISAR